MEVSSHNSSKTSLIVHEEDANISAFRRINKVLILSLVFLIILLTLTLAALIVYLVRLDNNDSPSPARAYCYVNSDAPACSSIVNLIISGKFVSDPNQIFALSLQAAAEDLQRLIASSLIEFNNCSSSLRDALDQIRDPLAAMRVDPFVEFKSDEQRGEMMNRIAAAAEDVETCLDKIGGGEELGKVKAYLNGAGDFLIGYAEALQMLETDKWARVYNNHEIRQFSICMCVSQLTFIIALFCSHFRIVKSRRKF
ncbi:uncharacterized protein LOC131023348 [Salvia miltiorrhiza]|uniref:uncharacterized protein LOC131023348 n=1 Tax=Salvia miltiorrhiza TaxID=226208 RepID=UPI0025ACA45C|nr:uncharacterized protein LOC131023348 [Salvia miltiorrhiza]